MEQRTARRRRRRRRRRSNFYLLLFLIARVASRNQVCKPRLLESSSVARDVVDIF